MGLQRRKRGATAERKIKREKEEQRAFIQGICP
jgi:hypothetical protein